jgi:chromosome partitioning protein
MPLQPSMIDIASFAEFLRFLSSADRNIRKSLDPRGFDFDSVLVLATRYKPTDRNKTDALDVLNHYAGRIMLRSPMIETTMFVGAGNRKETVYEYEPEDNKRAFDRAVEALDQVNGAIEAEILASWKRPVPATPYASAQSAAAE